jgi:hypothetical protein
MNEKLFTKKKQKTQSSLSEIVAISEGHRVANVPKLNGGRFRAEQPQISGVK